MTTTGDRFLIYDSKGTQDVTSGRVIVFSTRRNLELLATSRIWYLDGTFKVSPSIFTQVFTVLGTYNQNPLDPESTIVPFPFAYCLLSSKETCQYSAVLRALVSTAEEYGIAGLRPRAVMTDFELAIINAVRQTFIDISVNTCFFHFSQNLYRKIQELGLQASYNSADPGVRDYTHMTAALAFVPVGDVGRMFSLLREGAPEVMIDFFDYFGKTYVFGVPAQGRRRPVPPRYPPPLWNHYVSTLTDHSKTNNASEGWHNRFRLIVSKNHPDIFTAIQEFRKEQGDTEIQIVEMSLGRRVKSVPKKKWFDAQKRVKSLVESYENYGITRYGDYLYAIGCNIVISGN